jgi:hypothetical protein
MPSRHAQPDGSQLVALPFAVAGAAPAGEEDAATAMRMLTEAGESVYRIGRIETRTPGQARTVVG